MKNLFIIGNGFDIQHGIKSKYQDFHQFLRNMYMIDEFVDHSFDDFFPWKFNVPKAVKARQNRDSISLINIFGFIDYCLTKSENGNVPFNFYVNSDWCSIEDTLANLDLREFFYENFFNELLNKGDYGYDDNGYPIEYVMYDIVECFKLINNLMNTWAMSISIENIKPIKDFRQLFDCERDIFFTFNYTRTLEKVYGAKQVRHVHGVSGYKVLFGHKTEIDIDAFMQKNYIPSYCKRAVEILMEVTEKDTRKNSSEMDLYYLFLDKDITDIYSYGFSFSDVDLPYINDICGCLKTKNIVWHLSDFDSKEKQEEFKKKIRNCGFEGEFESFSIHSSSKRKLKRKDPYKQYIKDKKKYMGKAKYEINRYILDFYTLNNILRNSENKERKYKFNINKNPFFRLIKLIIIVFLETIINLIKKLLRVD